MNVQKGVLSMDDKKIIELFLKRDEKAIEETSQKYGKLCFSVAKGLLSDLDAFECVNDAYLALWNSIPPQIPVSFSTYLLKITKRLSIDKFRKLSAKKRGEGEAPEILSELNECIGENTEKIIEQKLLLEAINTFLKNLSETERKIFLQRYWYMKSLKEIAEDNAFSESKVKSMLFRIRQKLQKFLIKEDLM